MDEERYEFYVIFYIENELCNDDNDDNFFFEKLGDDILFIFDYELFYLNEIFNNDY